jgi:hypothetical protein
VRKVASLLAQPLSLRGWRLIDRLIKEIPEDEGSCCRLIVGMQRSPQEELRRALSLLKDGEIMSNGFAPVQRLSIEKLAVGWVSCFANRPAQLFDGAQKRLAILIGKRGIAEKRLYRTSYLRWKREERPALFAARVRYVLPAESFRVFPASLEKLGSVREVSAFSKLLSGEKLGRAIVSPKNNLVFYTRKFGYFLAFLDFVPEIWGLTTGERKLPTELKELALESPESVYATIAALSSTTFFWFWNVLSDCRNLNRRDLLAFPFNPNVATKSLVKALEDLGRKYLEALRSTSRFMVKSGSKIETFDYSSRKPILDEIDRLLAEHYGFTDEELDFIINYDIKYRMGRRRRVSAEMKARRNITCPHLEGN